MRQTTSDFPFGNPTVNFIALVPVVDCVMGHILVTRSRKGQSVEE